MVLNRVDGGTLRCPLPVALVLDAWATVLERESALSDVVARQPLLFGIRWRGPVASSYRMRPPERAGRRFWSSQPR
ncbi:hypothetical protein AB0L10_43775 [Streptomyces flaveolus]|uniref:hypothetical protein n=1 Tax=Streptomyces flaveolus TaxID=67297 RepID=UPI0034423A7A